MINRFELFLALRNQVDDRVLVRRALALEATMEELARAAGADPVTWGLAGLGADIGVRLSQENPDRRAGVTAEILLTEGAPTEVIEAARLFRQAAVAHLPRLALGLCAADLLVELVAEALAAEESSGLAGVDPRLLAHRIERGERKGNEKMARVAAALRALGLGSEQAAALALAAHLRIRTDLGL